MRLLWPMRGGYYGRLITNQHRDNSMCKRIIKIVYLDKFFIKSLKYIYDMIAVVDIKRAA